MRYQVFIASLFMTLFLVRVVSAQTFIGNDPEAQKIAAAATQGHNLSLNQEVPHQLRLSRKEVENGDSPEMKKLFQMINGRRVQIGTLDCSDQATSWISLDAKVYKIKQPNGYEPDPRKAIYFAFDNQQYCQSAQGVFNDERLKDKGSVEFHFRPSNEGLDRGGKVDQVQISTGQAQ